MSNETVTEIPLADLHESPFNARKVFRGVDELAASIQAEGRIHQPLLVRPRRPHPLLPDVQEGYEIVFGHRRFRAAGQVGMDTAPCMVRDMSDAQARSAQTHENLQREDVHPIEEAEGFASMIEHDGLTADELATVVGKSRSYVYERLALLHAIPSVRAACLADEIGAQVCLLVARLRTPKLQEKALAAIKGDTSMAANMEDGGKRSFRHIRDMLAEKFTLDLKGAIFDPENAGLVPEAGLCSTCPKRAGNAPEFEDLVAKKREGEHRGYTREGSPDVCTDPDCFDVKKKAHLKNEAARLEAAGKTVIDGNKARAAVSAYGDLKGGYIPLKNVRDAIKKAKANVDVVHIQNPRDGKVIQAVRSADIAAAGVKVAAEKPASAQRAHDWKAEERRREEMREKQLAANLALLNRVRAARPQQPGEFELREIARTLFELVDDQQDAATLRTLWPEMANREHGEFVGQLSIAETIQLILDCVQVQDVTPGYYVSKHETPEYLRRAAEHYGVSLADEGASTPAEAAPAPAKSKAGAGAKKGAKKAALAPVPGWPMPGSAAAAKPKAKSKTGGKAAGEQTDDAGSAGGSGGQVDALDEAEA
jgi:ParB/RepB/Spo0J family partition protein